jgi:hypothetical protein
LINPPEVLSADEIKSMDLAALVIRMDQVRSYADYERYRSIGAKASSFRVPLVADVMATSVVRQKDEKLRRRIADAAYRFLLQMDLVSVASGISNQIMFGAKYSEACWASPWYQMRTAVLGQYRIVASRIALECFFELIHLIDVGERIEGDSKFAKIKRWIQRKSNRFAYFIGHISVAYSFDRDSRQREIHGTSRYAHSVMSLKIPDPEEMNIPNDLESILLNVWSPLLKLLNNEEIEVVTGPIEFAQLYWGRHSNPEAFEAYVKAQVTGMK